MVKKISVRATEIETFQRQTVIVPNSEFINSAVGNWTHRNKLGRVDVKISVAYGTDARRAAEVMDAVVRSHPLVLKNPEPFVVFLNFGPRRWSSRSASSSPTSSTPMSCRTTSASRFSKCSSASGIEIPSNPARGRSAVCRNAAARAAVVAGMAEETPPPRQSQSIEARRRQGRRRRRADPTTYGIQLPFSFDLL